MGELSDVYLYTVDDLTEIIDENKRNRESEARKAETLIEEGVDHYLQKMRSLDVVSTLKAYRSSSELIRDAELGKALKLLAKGEDAERVLTMMARNLTNKFMHQPSIEMKKAGASGREELIGWAHTLFGLNRDDD